MPSTVILIASSTGGTRALRDLFAGMPRLNASILIVQHMPLYINESLRGSLDVVTDMDVKIASDGVLCELGCVYIAPSEVHMDLVNRLRIRLKDGPKVCFVRPSADVLMKSVRAIPGTRVIGIVLTGMGRDGAEGLEHIKKIGGDTFAQNEESCAVYGMPKVAVGTGSVDFVMSPSEMKSKLIQMVGLKGPAE